MNCLEMSYVSDDHTIAKLTEDLQQSAQAWRITDEKASCVTTENGASNQDSQLAVV